MRDLLRKPTLNEVFSVWGAARNHPRYQGCIGHWMMVEGGGTTLYDVSGGGNHGTLTNMDPATDWVSGQFGPALDFDGSNDYVGASPTLQVNDIPTRGGGLFVSAWIFPRTQGQGNRGRIISKGTGSEPSNEGWFFSLRATWQLLFSIRFATTALDRATANNFLTANTWQHVAVSWDGTTSASGVTIFRDGVAATSYALSNDGAGAYVSDAAVSPTIGANPSGVTRFFDGVIDNVRVYDRQSVILPALLWNDPFLEFRARRRVRAVTAAPPAYTPSTSRILTGVGV